MDVTATIERKISDATAVRDAAHRDYTKALRKGVNSGPTWVALGRANRMLDALKAQRLAIMVEASIKSEGVDATLAACEAPRTADGGVFDLGHWELMQLCLALDDAIAKDLRVGLSGESVKRLRQIFTTDGTVSVIVRHLPTD